ncbi:uncharacterized protein EAF02_002394 [Botrytis sinoallii]|uniref:uncharacterized protein n=1 Tax=Botrytis sinoallii TaxID=1463999 RepID=UPI0018FFCE9D|nr:uncharacterized protein EAF02_002394 [Botrytis sinoallii]KAF7889979.1 hypothetical protein EAF02_002394 [Botrytis sinoallii]
MTTTTLPSAIENQCAHCKAPAHRKCGGCSSPLGEEAVATIYYCTEKCQVEHWKLHKSACKAHQMKKLLYRAGETLQEIFYRYREVTFDIRVVKIEERNGTLYVDESYPNEESKMQMFHDFPVNLVQNVEDKHALLAQNACSEAITWMQEVTGHFLTGNCFKVILKNGGGTYSLDLTSAQYGYYLSYLNNRASSINSSNNFGEAKNKFTDLVDHLADPVIEVWHMNQGCSDAMKSGTVKWETEVGMPISNFLKLPQRQFEQKQKKLCDSVAGCLRSHQKRTLEQAGKPSQKPGGAPKTSFSPEGSLMDSIFELMKHA